MRPEDGMHLLDMALNDQHISQIGRIASLSDQISMLEERLDDCKYLAILHDLIAIV